MYVSKAFVQMFGLEAAKKLLAGALYHYCPTGANQFKAAGRWHTSPEPRDVIFFTNGTRAYHTGVVIEVTSTRVKTIEEKVKYNPIIESINGWIKAEIRCDYTQAEKINFPEFLDKYLNITTMSALHMPWDIYALFNIELNRAFLKMV